MKHFCPICRKPTDSDTDAEFPFCSERCRMADLGNWAAERYVVSEPVFEEDESEDGTNHPGSKPADKHDSDR